MKCSPNDRSFTWLVIRDSLGVDAICIDARDDRWVQRRIQRHLDAVPAAEIEIVHAAPGCGHDGRRLSRRAIKALETEICARSPQLGD